MPRKYSECGDLCIFCVFCVLFLMRTMVSKKRVGEQSKTRVQVEFQSGIGQCAGVIGLCVLYI